MPVCGAVYLNGRYVKAGDATVSPFDRGFLFGHAAYEVTAVYGGQMVDFDGHMARLARTLAGIGITNPFDAGGWRGIHETLIARNGMDEGLVYLQVTAGAYGARDFAGPEDYAPTVLAYCDTRSLIGETARAGIAAISVDDTRWARRDMKTTQLVSQALAYRAARDAGAVTAIMVEDGLITEAASANVWLVDGEGQLKTRDLSSALLAGITRGAVIRQLAAEGIGVIEAASTLEEACGAREVFTTSAGAMIAPVTSIDGQPIGDGAPGPMTRQVQRLYYKAMGADVATAAPWALS